MDDMRKGTPLFRMKNPPRKQFRKLSQNPLERGKREPAVPPNNAAKVLPHPPPPSPTSPPSTNREKMVLTTRSPPPILTKEATDPVPAASGDQEPVASNDPAPAKEATELLSTGTASGEPVPVAANEPTAKDTAKEATASKLVLASAKEEKPVLPPKNISVPNSDKEDATEVTDALSLSTGADADASLAGDSGNEPQRKIQFRTLDPDKIAAIAHKHAALFNLAEDTNKMTHKTNATVEKSAKDIEQVKGTQEKSAMDIEELKEVQKQLVLEQKRLLQAQQVANKEAKIQNMDKKEQRKTVEKCDFLENEVARLQKEKQHLQAKISKQRSKKKQALVESNKGNKMEDTVPASKKHVDLHSSPSKKSGAAKNLKNTQAAGRLKTKGKGF
ncbi:hypothetical protein ACHAXT_011587 [Thalassiosira profunda]